MFCPKCGTEQPESASFCQKCGTALAPPLIPQVAPAAADSSRKTLLIALVALGGLFVLSIILTTAFPSLKGPPPTPTPDVADDRGAWAICQTFVGRQLKAPSTASYASLADSKVITNGVSGVFAVTSYVDAQNSFGAQIRTPFQCNVQYQGGQNWTLLSLTLDHP